MEGIRRALGLIVGTDNEQAPSVGPDRVRLPLHSIPSPGVLEQSYYDRMPFLVSTTCVSCSLK